MLARSTGAHHHATVILHAAVPGRIRLKVPLIYRAYDRADRLRVELLNVSGVKEVTTNVLTENVLVLYDLNRINQEKLQKKIARLIRSKNMKTPRRLSTPGALPGSLEEVAKTWYHTAPGELAAAFQTSLDQGLSPSQAETRLKEEGLNLLSFPPRRSGLSILSGQLNNFPVMLLVGSAVISALTVGLADAAVIFGVVVINTAIGYVTESSAEKVIGSLSTPKFNQKVTLIRGGLQQRIPVSEIVRGDLVLLTPGMMIPADARVIYSDHLSVDESILTGESHPIVKNTDPMPQPDLALGDQINMIFCGTTVVGGSGRAIIVETGSQTEIGRIQQLMGETPQPETPLQIQLRHLGNQVVFASLAFSLTIIVMGLLKGRRFIEILRVSTSLAIAAIPESLPTIATTTLARGMRTLEDQGVLVRHLDALETLGGIDVICLDKTGTLTLNQMTVTEIITSAGRFVVTSDGFFQRDKKVQVNRFPVLNELIQIVTLCNEATLVERGKKPQSLGSSTEQALLRLSELAGLDPRAIRNSYRRVATRYRTENRSYMTTVHSLVSKPGTPKKRKMIATKGRPDEVLALCAFYFKGGAICPLTAETRRAISLENEGMAARALRVLGVSYKELGENQPVTENEMIWVGLVGMADPIRPELKHWIEKIHLAGIRTVMITGDQRPTAEAIGRALNLSDGEDLRVIDSSLLQEETFDFQNANRVHVFSRVSPADKLKIVKFLQSNGQVVAMLGDGINDGPALKIADVGIAMGAKGAEIASKAADIILLNDDLGKLVLALQEGRRIQDDIKKAVDYILVQNSAEILFTFLLVTLGLGEPLTPMQFLWMNLVTDLFPELALAQEPSEPGIMLRKPIHAENRLFGPKDIRRMTFDASALTFSTLITYLYAQRIRGRNERAQTIAFLTLVSGSLLYTVSARSEHSTLFGKEHLPPNKYIPLSVGAGFFAEGLAVGLPSLRSLLGTTSVGLTDLFLSGAGALLPQVIIELAKRSRQKSEMIGKRAA